VSTPFGDTNPIPIISGLLQGHPSSPILFNVVHDRILKALNGGTSVPDDFQSIASRPGVVLPGLGKRQGLGFADDLTLLAREGRGFSHQLDIVRSLAHENGIEIQPRKSVAVILAGGKRTRFAPLRDTQNQMEIGYRDRGVMLGVTLAKGSDRAAFAWSGTASWRKEKSDVILQKVWAIHELSRFLRTVIQQHLSYKLCLSSEAFVKKADSWILQLARRALRLNRGVSSSAMRLLLDLPPLKILIALRWLSVLMTWSARSRKFELAVLWFFTNYRFRSSGKRRICRTPIDWLVDLGITFGLASIAECQVVLRDEVRALPRVQICFSPIKDVELLQSQLPLGVQGDTIASALLDEFELPRSSRLELPLSALLDNASGFAMVWAYDLLTFWKARCDPWPSILGLEELIFYTDGSQSGDDTGWSVVCSALTPSVYVGRLPAGCSNNEAEALAVVVACCLAPPGAKVTIRTDSMYVVNLSGELSSAIDVLLRRLMRALVTATRVRVEHVRAHCGVSGNECADAAAKFASKKLPVMDTNEAYLSLLEAIDQRRPMIWRVDGTPLRMRAVDHVIFRQKGRDLAELKSLPKHGWVVRRLFADVNDSSPVEWVAKELDRWRRTLSLPKFRMLLLDLPTNDNLDRHNSHSRELPDTLRSGLCHCGQETETLWHVFWGCKDEVMQGHLLLALDEIREWVGSPVIPEGDDLISCYYQVSSLAEEGVSYEPPPLYLLALGIGTWSESLLLEPDVTLRTVKRALKACMDIWSYRNRRQKEMEKRSSVSTASTDPSLDPASTEVLDPEDIWRDSVGEGELEVVQDEGQLSIDGLFSEMGYELDVSAAPDSAESLLGVECYVSYGGNVR